MAVTLDRPESGLLYRGLALRLGFCGSPKGRRPPTWLLFHIGTGHLVCSMEAHDPLLLATELAECGEWDFDGLEGYRNCDPDLMRKVGDILSRTKTKLGPHGCKPDEAAARAVAVARA